MRRIPCNNCGAKPTGPRSWKCGTVKPYDAVEPIISPACEHYAKHDVRGLVDAGTKAAATLKYCAREIMRASRTEITMEQVIKDLIVRSLEKNLPCTEELERKENEYKI